MRADSDDALEAFRVAASRTEALACGEKLIAVFHHRRRDHDDHGAAELALRVLASATTVKHCDPAFRLDWARRAVVAASFASIAGDELYRALMHLGNAERRDSPDQARVAYVSAYQTAQLVGDPVAAGRALISAAWLRHSSEAQNEARKAVELARSLATRSDLAPLLHEAAGLLADHGELETAAAYLRESLGENPSALSWMNPIVHGLDLLADVCLLLGRLDEAEESWRRFAEIWRGSTYTERNHFVAVAEAGLALVALARNDTAAAMTLVGALPNLDPVPPRVQVARALIAASAGKLGEARGAADRLLEQLRTKSGGRGWAYISAERRLATLLANS